MPRLSSLPLGALLLLACGQRNGAQTPPTPPPRLDATSASTDAADALAPQDARADAPAGEPFTPPTQIMALGVWVPVRQNPRRDAPLAGYLRGGAIVDVESGPHGRERCPVRRGHPEGGWYRVRGGGFVCVGGALATGWPTRDVLRPAQPTLDAGMPYRYGIVYGRTNLWRAPPSQEELRTFETRSALNVGSSPSSSAQGGGESGSGGEDDPPRPPPRPTLGELRGERSGPVIRRLLVGMYLALDRTVRDRETDERYWRTQSGGFVRDSRLGMLTDIPSFQGYALAANESVPYLVVMRDDAWVYRLTEGPNVRAIAERRVPKYTGIALSADPPVQIGRFNYYRTVDGTGAVPDYAGRLALPRDPPADLGEHEKWIDVDIATQMLVAYEGRRAVYVTLVSTGRSNSGPERYETPAGIFRIRSKHVSTTMDGDTAHNGPYSIEDVPWAMYFHENYAIHGAFWHHWFGFRMSHGCVNLAPNDARWVFGWAEPALPEGWHGVMATEEHPGTRVLVHRGPGPQPTRPTWTDDLQRGRRR